jgi:Tfp pilus assembly protein PilO
MSENARFRGWVVTLSLASVAVGYLVLLYLPGHRAISQASERLEEQRQVLEQSPDLVTALNLAEQEVETAERFVTGWEENWPRTGELSQLYGELYALAEAAGAQVTRFDPEAIVCAERLLKIPLKVGCQGDFKQVFRFLAGLEGLRYEVWINDLRMQSGLEDGEYMSCELSLITFAGNSEKSDYVEQTD